MKNNVPGVRRNVNVYWIKAETALNTVCLLTVNSSFERRNNCEFIGILGHNNYHELELETAIVITVTFSYVLLYQELLMLRLPSKLDKTPATHHICKVRCLLVR